jgi:hypothetical protein
MSFSVSPSVGFAAKAPRIPSPPVLSRTSVREEALPNGNRVITTVNRHKANSPGASERIYTHTRTLDSTGRPISVVSTVPNPNGKGYIQSESTTTYTRGIDGKLHVNCRSVSIAYDTRGNATEAPKIRVTRESY